MASLEEQLRASILYEQARERNEGKRGLVAVVDLAHIFRSAWHATADQPLNAAYDYTVDKVAQILGTRTYDRVVCAIDAPPYRRTQFYPQYKGNREKPDPAMLEQYRRAQEHARRLGCVVLEAAGFEADDVIATLVKHLTKDGYSAHVFTGDKDLMQLVNDRVHVVSTRTGDVFDARAVFDKFGVIPGQVRDLLALTGDRSDNVPGCPGVGDKTAAKLLTEYGTVDAVLSATNIRGKLGINLAEHAKDVLVSSTLVTLVDDVPLDYGAVWEEQEVQEDDIERAAIVEEPTEANEERPAPERPAGDVLAGGALARRAMEAEEITEETSVAPLVAKHGLDRAADGASAGIQLRPGVSISQDDFQLGWRLAKALNDGGLYRRKFSTAEEIFTVILLAQELDLGIQACLSSVHMIEGRPTLGSHLIAALAQRDPSVLYFECAEQSATSCTYICKKRGLDRELTFTYTLEDAVNDGHRWAKKAQNQKAMLRKTAAAQAARLWVPGAALGLYAPEEFGVEVDDTAAA